jgi:FMN phosphatase YigB (HAD superfamily)
MKHSEIDIVSGGWRELLSISYDEPIIHYSFDFWNTIAFSNPIFKTERSNYIYELLNGKINLVDIDDAFIEVGRNYNLSIEKGGQVVNHDILYDRVFNLLNMSNVSNKEKIISEILDLFLKHPPIIDEEFINFLNSIESNITTLSITSNTAFIPGRLIEVFLRQHNIRERFAFCFFSDVLSISKPNSMIFNKILSITKSDTLSSKSVIHIGDNLITDYFGATNAGLSAFHLVRGKTLKYPRNALHVITDSKNLTFSSNDYSKFKFGSSSIAIRFGSELFKYFRTFHLDRLILCCDKIIVYSSPYTKVPTSSYFLTHSFYASLEQYLSDKNINDVKLQLGKIERCQTYTDDYGSMTADERLNLIQDDTYKFIDVPSTNNLCIFIDDISVTGTHQMVIEKLLDSYNVQNANFFLYFAKLSNLSINPSFENCLNYSYINEFPKFIELITSDDYQNTTRSLKYILSLDSFNLHLLIKTLIESNKYDTLSKIVQMCYDNQYNSIELYKKNLLIVEAALVSP